MKNLLRKDTKGSSLQAEHRLYAVIYIVNYYSIRRLFKEDKSIRAILDYYPIVTSNFDFSSGMYVNRMDYQEDVINLYDALYDNLDDILKDYA